MRKLQETLDKHGDTRELRQAVCNFFHLEEWEDFKHEVAPVTERQMLDVWMALPMEWSYDDVFAWKEEL